MTDSRTMALIDALEQGAKPTREEWRHVLTKRNKEIADVVFQKASAVRDHVYGKKIYIRGLIEFTNYCKNDCYYCGIRRSAGASRYRLSKEEILSCCESGYAYGFRTFVLQGGEDPYFTEDRMEDLIRAVKSEFPDCALTLSVGEKSEKAYRKFREAGADRYLLRHETANREHYERLHPSAQTLEHRMSCLAALKRLGFQTGAGFMVGSPYQTTECFIDDLQFLQEFRPEMVGIGPFIPHHDTPFAGEEAGSVELTLYLLALVRLMLPCVLLPATTALGTASENGTMKGILAGANVVMPNLSPQNVRGKYLLYDNKRNTGLEAGESLALLKEAVSTIGYEVVTDRGDYQSLKGKKN